MEADALNQHIQTTFSVNGTATDDGVNHVETFGSSRQQAISGTAIFNLSADDTIEVAIRTTDAGTPTLSIDHLNLVIFRVYGSGAGNTGAPINAQYLTLALNDTLTEERLFTPDLGLVATDGGANSTYTLDNKDIGARVYNSSDIVAASGANTVVTFDSERWDTDTIHSTVANTSRLTAKTAGKYLITGGVAWEPNNSGVRIVHIRLNGANLLATQLDFEPSNVWQTFLIVTTIYNLAVNDYVELVTYHDSAGGNLDLKSFGDRTPEFSMQMMAEV
jgi:hypothetical protein